jgi:hypothetical protein
MTVTTTTRLEPLPLDRARELFDMVQEAQSGADSALALDSDGRVIGVVPADDPHPRHLLGDLDVHA